MEDTDIGLSRANAWRPACVGPHDVTDVTRNVTGVAKTPLPALVTASRVQTAPLTRVKTRV